MPKPKMGRMAAGGNSMKGSASRPATARDLRRRRPDARNDVPHPLAKRVTCNAIIAILVALLAAAWDRTLTFGVSACLKRSPQCMEHARPPPGSNDPLWTTATMSSKASSPLVKRRGPMTRRRRRTRPRPRPTTRPPQRRRDGRRLLAERAPRRRGRGRLAKTRATRRTSLGRASGGGRPFPRSRARRGFPSTMAMCDTTN